MLGGGGVRRITVISTDVCSMSDRPDIAREDDMLTPGGWDCAFLTLSLYTLLLSTWIFVEGEEDQLGKDKFLEEGMVLMADATRKLVRMRAELDPWVLMMGN